MDARDLAGEQPSADGKVLLEVLHPKQRRLSHVSPRWASPWRAPVSSRATDGGVGAPCLVQPTGDLVTGLDFLEHRVLLGTDGLDERAARGETAAGGDLAAQG